MGDVSEKVPASGAEAGRVVMKRAQGKGVAASAINRVPPGGFEKKLSGGTLFFSQSSCGGRRVLFYGRRT